MNPSALPPLGISISATGTSLLVSACSARLSASSGVSGLLWIGRSGGVRAGENVQSLPPRDARPSANDRLEKERRSFSRK